MKLFVYRSDQRPPAEYDYYIDQNGHVTPALPSFFPEERRIAVMLENGEALPSSAQQQAIELMIGLVQHEVFYAFRPDQPTALDASGAWWRRTFP
ncbi:hypothetical protein [Rhizobium sp. Rhizsp82]|uniref:hypothetical protein n=1 Tax=Rhizobium sp. Rhizsp82 TaxID=3243057 RepID=UPI0039B45A8C